MDDLELFKSSFRTGFETEMALITMVDDICWEMEKENISLLAGLLVAFNGIPLDIN